MVILTLGLTGKAVNIQGTVELCLPTEQFHFIFAGEKQSETGENLLLLLDFLICLGTLFFCKSCLEVGKPGDPKTLKYGSAFYVFWLFHPTRIQEAI